MVSVCFYISILAPSSSTRDWYSNVSHSAITIDVITAIFLYWGLFLYPFSESPDRFYIEGRAITRGCFKGLVDIRLMAALMIFIIQIVKGQNEYRAVRFNLFLVEFFACSREVKQSTSLLPI